MLLTRRNSMNMDLVMAVYKALASADMETLKLLLAKDLEWWFHGPPMQQHLMRMLTGLDRLGSFSFVPLRVHAIDHERVIVEGSGPAANNSSCWVHIWTAKDDQITQIRECFNTSVTVTGLQRSLHVSDTLWQTQFTESHGRTMPGLILAI